MLPPWEFERVVAEMTMLASASISESTPVLTDVRWQRVQTSGPVGGAYMVAELKGQTASTEFRGTAVTLQTAEGPKLGQVALYVDGELAVTGDLSGPTLTFGRTITVDGLSDTRHTLEVRVLGSGSGAGTAVVVDGLSVQ